MKAVESGGPFVCLQLWLGAALLVFAAAEATAAEPGAYLSVGVGIAKSGSLDSSVYSINHPTRCDSLLYGDPSTAPTGGACADNTPKGLFSNRFDPGAGFVGGISLGYAFGKLRFEGEYLNRYQGGDEKQVGSSSAGNIALITKDSEWNPEDPPSERISDFNAHQFFLNAYYDFLNNSSWTPYLGAGVGVGQIKMLYSARLLRRDDLGDLGPEEWREAAAGTLSYLDANLEGTRFGFQGIGGLDYALSEKVSIGAKARWTRFDGFTAEDELWTVIRSHRPVFADGRTPFTSDVILDDLGHWTIAVEFKYRF